MHSKDLYRIDGGLFWRILEDDSCLLRLCGIALPEATKRGNCHVNVHIARRVQAGHKDTLIKVEGGVNLFWLGSLEESIVRALSSVVPSLVLRILTLFVGTIDSTGTEEVVYVSSRVHHRDLLIVTFVVGARGIEGNRDLGIFEFSLLKIAHVFRQPRFFNCETS